MLTKERIDQFYKDVESLGLKYPVAEITRITGEHKGNVSKYLSRKSEPSESFIDKFYDGFKNVFYTGKANEKPPEDQQKIILDTSFILDLLSETRKEKAILLEVIQANLNTLQVTQQVILAEIKAGLKWEAIKAGAGSEKKTAEVLHKIDTIVDEYMPAVSHAGSKERT